MNYGNFSKIAMMYGLNKNKDYVNSVWTILEWKTCKEEEIEARKSILKAVMDMLESNSGIVGYLTEEEKRTLLNLGDVCSKDIESEEDLTALLNKLVECGTRAYEKFTIDKFMARLNEIADKYQIIAISVLLNKIKDNISDDDKKYIISKAFITLNGIVNKKNYSVDENLRMDLVPLNRQYSKIVDLLKDAKCDICELYTEGMENIQESEDLLVLFNDLNRDKKGKKKGEEKRVKVNISKNGKKIIAGVVAAAILTTGGVIVYNTVKKNNKEVDGDTSQSITDTDRSYISKGNGGIVEKPIENVDEDVSETTIPSTPGTTVDTLSIAKKLKNNWDAIGVKYELQEIEELVKFAHGFDSVVDINTFDTIITNVINAAAIPGVNNAIMGGKVQDVHELELSDLLKVNSSGIAKIEVMEGYLNGLLTDADNIKSYAKLAVLEELRANLIGMDEMDDICKLVWARLAEVGINPIVGTLGGDFSVEINGISYKQTIVNNPDIYESIISEVKTSFTK